MFRRSSNNNNGSKSPNDDKPAQVNRRRSWFGNNKAKDKKQDGGVEEESPIPSTVNVEEGKMNETDKDSEKKNEHKESDFDSHSSADLSSKSQGSGKSGNSTEEQMGTGSKTEKEEINDSKLMFFAESNEINRYTLHEVIGKGSYGTVSSATDRSTNSRVAIKKITDIFENVSDATRILREIKLLRLLKHRDIVSVHSILLPPMEKEFEDIYVVFELMETDLHQVIKANDDMTIEHHRYFIYQLLRGLKYIHAAKVYHRDLKPKNVLVNSDCKLKICDFGLARPMFEDAPQAVFWTDYVATRWYRAPELCGSFFTKYSPTVDIWSLGCIFAEIMMRRPLFPGKNVVDQLQIITDLVGVPSEKEIAQVRNEKARRFLNQLPFKEKVNFKDAFPGIDAQALDLLEWMIQFDPRKRPTAELALEHPFLASLHNLKKEPTCSPVSKLEFGFDFKKMTIEEVRKLIYREILEYHPEALKRYIEKGEDDMGYVVPGAADRFRMQFAEMEGHGHRPRPSNSMPPEKIRELKEKQSISTKLDSDDSNEDGEKAMELDKDIKKMEIR